jgi:hypothetical protein
LKELDDDESESSNSESSSSEEYDLDSSDDEATKNQAYEQVAMILSSFGSIFYVVSFEGQCTIKEIDPNDDSEKHVCFEIKA